MEASERPFIQRQPDYYLVLSLVGNGAKEEEEVVEVTAHLIKTLILEVEEEEFHAYVRPSKGGSLPPGRKAYAISSAKGFREVSRDLDKWLEETFEISISNDKIQVVVENSKLFGALVRSQCQVLGTGLPWFGTSWVNLRMEFRDVYGISDPVERISFLAMIKDSGLKFEGKKDSSWDCAFNAALLTAHLLKKGRLFKHLDALEDL